jgi:ribonuclease T2
MKLTRRFDRGLKLAIAAFAVLSVAVYSLQAKDADKDADFDFYVLALSWSPSFCATPQGRDNPGQCGSNKRYDFIVHGLWPQYERGYPQQCSTQYSLRTPRELENDFLDIMPSRGLIRHQWRKHGTCSGLSQGDYFDKTRRAFETVTIPAIYRQSDRPRITSAQEVENAFSRANPTLDSSEMAVRCDRRRVREVRICLTKDLEPRACKQVDSGGCRASGLSMPAPR